MEKSKQRISLFLGLVVMVFTAGTTLAQDAQGETSSGSQDAKEASRPDFSGHWTANLSANTRGSKKDEKGNICVVNCGPRPGGAYRPTPEFPAYREEHQEQVAKLNKEQVLHDPTLRCLNPGLPRVGPPDKIIQTDDELAILYDDLSGAFWRVIPTDGRAHKKYAEKNFFGDSVGNWQGDKLVIESVSFNDESWLTDNGAFHSADMRIIEELSLSKDEEGAIVYRVTVHDPAVLKEPWVLERTLRPSTVDLLEPVPCIETSLDQMTGITSYHPNSRW